MKSNEEIKADLNLFFDIQIGKYLKKANKSEFSDDAEAKLVLNQVINVYNKSIACDRIRLDNLNAEAKAAWFNSIEIDFQNNISEEILDCDELYDGEIEKLTKIFNERFPFLPEGSIGVLLFVGPALEAYGLPFERFQELMLGEDECTELEEELFIWAFELTLCVMGSLLEKKKAIRQKAYNDAVRIAKEELSERDSIAVVEAIQLSIEDFEKKLKEQNPKARKK